MKIGSFIDRTGAIASILALLIVVIPIIVGVVKINDVQERTKEIETVLTEVQYELQSEKPLEVLNSYFFYIEQNELEKAWDLFTEDKKVNTLKGYEGFREWLENFVAFEGLKVSSLTEKDSASSKVYLAEFNFKKRGMKPVPSKWGFYLKYDGKEWRIDYSNVLYERNWKEGSCEFYDRFPHCS